MINENRPDCVINLQFMAPRMDIKHCCCWRFRAKRIGGTRLKSSPLEIAFRSHSRKSIWWRNATSRLLWNQNGNFHSKSSPNYCFNDCCSQQCTLVRSFQVWDEHFAKSRLPWSSMALASSLKGGRTSFLIISPRAPVARTAGYKNRSGSQS